MFPLPLKLFGCERFSKEILYLTDDDAHNLNSENGLRTGEAAKKILLAEDDASVRRFLEVVLSRAGYIVTAVEDGSLALQKAFETPFDLIVLDAVMPNLSGHEVCRILRSRPDFENIKLIILSGIENEVGDDADLYLLKTANVQDELLSALANLLTVKL